MSLPCRHILVIADIEGSSGCHDYEASSFRTMSWARACRDMTLDVKAVTGALLASGAESVTVKDFHRTGYNIFPELLNERVSLVSGYRNGPVPGIGDPGNAEVVMMIGMHAPSGSDGFLAHTMTSRIARLLVNGSLLSEAQVFAASLSPYGIRPVFFSGCPVACRYAREAIPRLETYAIDKSAGPAQLNIESWRKGLAETAVRSLQNMSSEPYVMKGPFEVEMTMRDGSPAAEKLARRWNYSCEDDTIHFSADDFQSLYYNLIRICYLTPLVEKLLPHGLGLYNLYGYLGLRWARKHGL